MGTVCRADMSLGTVINVPHLPRFASTAFRRFTAAPVAPSRHDEVERRRKPYGKGGTDHEGRSLNVRRDPISRSVASVVCVLLSQCPRVHERPLTHFNCRG